MTVLTRPSHLDWTTVLVGVKGALASLCGFAALDVGSAPFGLGGYAMAGTNQQPVLSQLLPHGYVHRLGRSVIDRSTLAMTEGPSQSGSD